VSIVDINFHTKLHFDLFFCGGTFSQLKSQRLCGASFFEILIDFQTLEAEVVDLRLVVVADHHVRLEVVVE